MEYKMTNKIDRLGLYRNKFFEVFDALAESANHTEDSLDYYTGEIGRSLVKQAHELTEQELGFTELEAADEYYKRGKYADPVTTQVQQMNKGLNP